MKFVAGKPALTIGSTLVVADLHLGIEFELRKKGVMLPFQYEKTAREINSLLKQTHAKKLVVLGDAKHDVYGLEERAKRMMHSFFSLLHAKEITVVKGNHDSELQELKEINLVPAKGFILEEGGEAVGLAHGHAWPEKELFETNYLITGHNHPLTQFCDKLGFCYSEKTWIVGELKENKAFSTRRQKTIVMPAYSSLSGGLAFNAFECKQLLGPLFENELFNLRQAQAILLNGVRLGKISILRRANWRK